MRRTLLFSLFTIHFSLFTCLADVPVAINYVGHLEGEALKGDEQVLLMVFRLYDKPGTGLACEKKTALWGRQASVTLLGGDFDVDLKDSFGSSVADTAHVSLADALAAAVAGGSSDLYLGLTPANDQNAEIFPRQRLTAIPKAVQARAVRTIPADFTAPQLSFEQDGTLKVTGAAEFQDGVSYAAAKFEPGAQTSFRGGVDVAGTLQADSVSAKTIKAQTVSSEDLQTTGSGALAVSEKSDFAGETVWSGNFSAPSVTASVARIEANISTDGVAAEVLNASNFVNRSTEVANQFYRHTGTWRLIGAWKEETESTLRVSADERSFVVYDPQFGGVMNRTSLTVGTWEAPTDCLALFQTHVFNRRDDVTACVQFYIVPDANFNSFNTLEANGAASLGNGNGGTLETTVPLLLRKGQIVKWLTYNDNKAKDSEFKERDNTKVTAVRWQPFQW